jgi:hypothetical protein
MDQASFDYELLVQMKCTDLPMAYHQSLFSHKKNCFRGRELVDWVTRHKELDDKEAFIFAQHLLYDGAVVEIKDRQKDFSLDGKYRLVIDTERDGVLNLHQIGKEAERRFSVKRLSALEQSKQLRNATMELYSKYLTEDGSAVDYERLQRSREFNIDYRNAVHALQFVTLDDMEEVERKCFFINIYNTLMINGLIVIGKPKGILEKKNFYSYCKYNIGGYQFSLNDIEHGVLRANRKPYAALKRLFNSKDPRLQFVVAHFDPRIHFALNCGAKSCPPIKMYVPERLDVQLKLAGTSFCDQEVQVVHNKIIVSKIFQWYYSDFGNNDTEVAKYIATFITDQELLAKLERVINTGKAKIKFQSYDWSLNHL